MITAEQLKEIGIDEKWLDPLNQTFDKFEINTPNRIAGFIGQCQHESAKFTRLTENLNYSGKALHAVWPSRFKTEEEMEAYHRQPEKIANKVYADRMGNGDEASGEGWKYRGRGVIQLTGKANYAAASDAIGVDFVDQPDLVTEPLYAVMTAGWFWKTNKLNYLCDSQDWKTLTKRINGGTIGLEDRIKHIEHVLEVLNH